MLKSLFFAAILLIINFNVYAVTGQAYTASDIGKIAAILGIVILIFSPAKIRVIIIGTIIGLIFSYYTYTFIAPIFISSLNGP
ncbi:MAG TPA: DUF5510 family protein [Rickettsia endosymbiont of Pyrocoelia pectoralis]|nr:DUF5510 family protein [Rickettsia endosymbiont of Pyrocoelia pectoralis]